MSDESEKAPSNRRPKRERPAPGEVEVVKTKRVKIQKFDIQKPVVGFLRPADVVLARRPREYRVLDGDMLYGMYRGDNLTPEQLVQHLRRRSRGSHDGSSSPYDLVVYEGEFCVAVLRDYANPRGEYDVLYVSPLSGSDWALHERAVRDLDRRLAEEKAKRQRTAPPPPEATK